MHLLFVATKATHVSIYLLFVLPVKLFEALLYIKLLHKNAHTGKEYFSMQH